MMPIMKTVPQRMTVSGATVVPRMFTGSLIPVSVLRSSIWESPTAPL